MQVLALTPNALLAPSEKRPRAKPSKIAKPALQALTVQETPWVPQQETAQQDTTARLNQLWLIKYQLTLGTIRIPGKTHRLSAKLGRIIHSLLRLHARHVELDSTVTKKGCLMRSSIA